MVADIAQEVGICAFDELLAALEGVVEHAQSLSLDSKEDRAELVRRLHSAVGVVDGALIGAGAEGRCPGVGGRYQVHGPSDRGDCQLQAEIHSRRVECGCCYLCRARCAQ